MTRLCDLFDFGQLFKAFGNNLICSNLPHSYAIYVKVSKSLIFLVKSFWATFIDIWRRFTGHTRPTTTNDDDPSCHFCCSSKTGFGHEKIRSASIAFFKLGFCFNFGLYHKIEASILASIEGTMLRKIF